MKLPINLTPAKAIEILRAYFPKADGYHVTIDCCVDSYKWRDEIGTCFNIHAWQEGKAHITGGGPTLSSALSLLLEGREPVKLFTEDPEAVHFFKSAEDDAEALRLAALSAGYYRSGHVAGVLLREWPDGRAEIWAEEDPVGTRSASRDSTDIPITYDEAFALTGGAL